MTLLAGYIAIAMKMQLVLTCLCVKEIVRFPIHITIIRAFILVPSEDLVTLHSYADLPVV